MKRPEHIVFLISMAALGALVAWWLVFARGLSSETYDLTRNYLTLTIQDPVHLQEQLKLLDARYGRRLLMIAGEGGTFALLLLVCTVILFGVARQARRGTQRMERVLQFTTHELKTPIAGVKALLQSLALGSVPEASRKGLLDQGVAECNRLEHLTESILAYQRALTRTSVVGAQAKQLVEQVLEHRQETLGAEALVTRLDEQRVQVDRDAFRVVFENLLDNARKYGNGGPVEITGRASPQGYRLEVRDKGIGFRPEQAEALFDPFTRESRGETVKTHGSGLGLYISRQLAERFGARLTAYSEGPGQGAAFLLALRPESG